MSGQKSKSRLSQLQSTAIPKNKLSNYQKKQLLKMLTDDGCHPDQLNKMSSRFKIADTNVIKDFVNIQAESSQNRLEKIFRTKNQKHFMNLDECAKSIVENNQTASDNMLPVTLEAIANLEKHPPPGEVSGVDLKALYQMLANMSAGYPVKDLPEGPTKEFLKQCYTELMDSVSDMEPKSFRDTLIEQEKQTKPVYSWLCNSDYSQYINLIFNDVCSDSDDDE